MSKQNVRTPAVSSHTPLSTLPSTSTRISLPSASKNAFFFQAEDGIRGLTETGVQTCALPICTVPSPGPRLVTLRCRFDFVFSLEPPDLRACAAMLSGLEVAEAQGWRPVAQIGRAHV